MYKLNLPKKVYFKTGSYTVALRELNEVYHRKRAFVVSDQHLYTAGIVTPVIHWVEKQGLRTAEFFSVDDVPTFAALRAALPSVLAFKPDAIIGVGGGAAMSAAKALWALYENPELDLAAAVKDPTLLHTGEKALLALVATSFGSGAQNSPFAVLRDDEGKLVQLESQCLLPVISSTDALFTASMTAEQVHKAGAKSLAQAMRALAAEDCCEYPGGLLDQAIGCILRDLKAAEEGCPAARERVHDAVGIAGATYGNVTLPADVETRLAPMAAKDLVGNGRVAHLARKLGYADAAALVKACEAIYG